MLTEKEYVDMILLGDSEQVLKEIPEGVIDLIASDPPYQLSSVDKTSNKDKIITKGLFNAKWDVLPSVGLLKECFRVLKPGAFSFWVMTPRQDCILEFLSRLKEAGFIISYSSLYWTYGTGFSKAVNMSKAVDKKLGFERKKIPATGNFHKGRGAFAEVYKEGQCVDNIPLSDEAKRLDGAYSPGLKPAVEVVLVAMRPLQKGCKTYLDQALTNNHGVFWNDSCRIPYASEDDKEHSLVGFDQEDVDNNKYGSKNMEGGFGLKEAVQQDTTKGRFPANIIISDKILDDGSITKTKPHDGDGESMDSNNQGWGFKRMPFSGEDEGGFSRFFDVDRWYEEKIKQMPKELRENVKHSFPFLIVPKPSVSEREDGLEKSESEKNPVEGENIKSPNIHPTIKPITLFSYLIHLGTRKGETVLDPFSGSGTTAVSAYQCSRRFVGIEREKDYHKVSVERINNAKAQSKLDAFF